MSPVLRWSIALLGLALTSIASAQTPAHPCAALADPDARLACYDRAFPPAVARAQDPAATQRRDFGLSGVEREERQAARGVVPAPALDRIRGKVTALRIAADGRRMVELDNDQLWLLTEGSTRGRIELGDEVTVRAAALSSFMLVTKGGAGLRARRVR